MSRRPSDPGHFTLFKRTNGYWYYYLYDDFGLRHQYSTGQRTKTRAQDYVARMLQGTLPVRKQRHPLADYCKDFYDFDTSPYIRARLARQKTYSRKLAKTNQSALDRHIVPYLGDIPVESLTKALIDSWIIELPENEDISNKTANTALTLLRQVLEQAREEGLIKENPAAEVKPLAKLCDRSTKRAAFTMAQIKTLFKERWDHRPIQIACILSAGTGMRLGEIRALTAEQIHEDYIEVNASWSEAVGLKTTKSGFGRIVPLSMEMRYILDEIMPPSGLLFTYNGTTPISPSRFAANLKKEMKKRRIVAKPGQTLSFHSFRHYFNTRLIAGGIAGDKIRAVIGHESEEMTEHYAHLENYDLDEIKAIQRLAINI